MSNQRINLLEVALKVFLKIPLVEAERQAYFDMDNDFKESCSELVNNPEFLDEVKKLSGTIISKSQSLSLEEKEYIKNKCQKHITYLTSQVTEHHFPNSILK